MNVTFSDKRNFADVIKLKILRWEDDPKSSQWAIMQSESIYNAIRGRQMEILHRREEDIGKN